MKIFPHPTPIAPEDFHKLSLISTCAISNAIESFHTHLRNEGFIHDGLTCRFPHFAPVLGYAMPLQVRSANPPSKGNSFLESNDWWEMLLTIPAPRILVIQDMDRQPGIGALAGEVHAKVFQALNCSGLITNGAIRDLPQLENLGFQVFSSHLSVSHAYAHIVQAGTAVEIGGLRILPGELLHADQHGVISIPKELATRLPDKVAELQAKEEKILHYCDTSDFTLEGLRQLLGS